MTKDELKDVDELLDEVTAKLDHLKPQGHSQSVGIPLISLLGQELIDAAKVKDPLSADVIIAFLLFKLQSQILMTCQGIRSWRC